MATGSPDVLFFGDQTGLSLEFLTDALRRTKRYPLSAAFATGATKTLRYELANLPHNAQISIPHFSTLSELAERLVISSPKHPAIDSALLSASQFVHFFG